MSDEFSARLYNCAMGVHNLILQKGTLGTFRKLITQFKEERRKCRKTRDEMRSREIDHAKKILEEKRRLEGFDKKAFLTGPEAPDEGWEYAHIHLPTETGFELVEGWCPPDIVEYRRNSQKASIDEHPVKLSTQVAWLAALHDAQLTAAEPIISPTPELGTDTFDPDLFIMPAVCTNKHMTEDRLQKLELFLVEVKHEFSELGSAEPTVSDDSLSETRAVDRPAPDFAAFMKDDPPLAQILSEHYREAWDCLLVGAHTATVVLLGSILEGCLCYLVKKHETAARDTKAAKNYDKKGERPVEKWTLGPLMNVAKELSWITNAAASFVEILPCHRNLIHPYRKLRNTLNPDEQSCTYDFVVLDETVKQLKKKA